MADQVAGLIASRLGGARRGEQPPLHVILRRRGGALPRRLRKPAARLAEAGRLAAQPRIARQMDLHGLSRDRDALVAHLQPLGEIGRWRGRAVGVAASLAFGLLVLAALTVWLMVRRGHL